MKTRSPRKRTNLKRYNEVLDAAIHLFCERGYPSTSIHDVADSVGMLKGSLYYYIKSKEDLLFQILSDADEMMDDIQLQIQSLDTLPLERMRTFIKSIVRWYCEHFEHATVTFKEWMHLTGDQLEIQLQRRQKYEDMVKNLLLECQESGDVSKELDVSLARSYILGAINAVPQWYQKQGPETPETIASLYSEMTISMLTGVEPVTKTKRVKRAAKRKPRQSSQTVRATA